MLYSSICGYAEINATDPAHVAEIKQSILEHGWIGAPILVHEASGLLITGSHRIIALREIEREHPERDLDDLGDIAEPVDDIIEAYCEADGCTFYGLPLSSLREIFAGTWVEKYADELEEW